MVEIIKQAAVEAVGDSKPAAVLFGTVTSIKPLKINVEQRLILEEDFLILTSNVRDHDIEMTVEHITEDDASINSSHTHESSATIQSAKFSTNHKHAYKGKKTFTVHNGLKNGEMVILIQVQGGQKFIVLDRMVI